MNIISTVWILWKSLIKKIINIKGAKGVLTPAFAMQVCLRMQEPNLTQPILTSGQGVNREPWCGARIFSKIPPQKKQKNSGYEKRRENNCVYSGLYICLWPPV
jgi:hypothetical protein